MKHNLTFAEVYTALVASGWPQWEAIREALSRLDWLDRHEIPTEQPDSQKTRGSDI
jgi:hypothetical protein